MSIIKNILIKVISPFKNKGQNAEWSNKKESKLSIVILCYNGQKYLSKRLNSIMNQTYTPYEIIFLDDASTDNSVELAKHILKDCKIKYQIKVNSKNEGCCNQIIKGLHAAKGELIWFAEQDDYCNIEFLSTMEKMFADNTVDMSCCRSTPVNENYQKLEYYYSSEDKLQENYCVDGSLEVINKLCIKNTIPNFSSVVFRKSALKGVEKHIKKCRIFFDWMIYSYVLKKGRLCYCAEPLNFHLRHEESIIAKNRRNPLFYEDIFCVKNYILDNYDIPRSNIYDMLLEIDKDYRLFGCEGYASLNIKDHPVLRVKYYEFLMKIIDKI